MNFKNKGSKSSVGLFFGILISGLLFGGTAYLWQQKRMVDHKQETNLVVSELETHIKQKNQKINELQTIIRQQNNVQPVKPSAPEKKPEVDRMEKALAKTKAAQQNETPVTDKPDESDPVAPDSETKEEEEEKEYLPIEPPEPIVREETSERYWGIYSIEYTFGVDHSEFWKNAPGRSYKVCRMDDETICGTVVQYDGPYKDYLMDLYIYLAQQEDKTVSEPELQILYDQVPRDVTEIKTPRKTWKHGYHYYDGEHFFHESDQGSIIIIYNYTEDNNFSKAESEKLIQTIDYGEISEVVNKNSGQRITSGSGTAEVESNNGLQRKVRLYYQNLKQKDIDVCSPDTIAYVERTIPFTQTPIADTLKLLLQGKITQREKEMGVFTEFPQEGFTFNGASLENDVLTLKFTEVPGFTSGGACRVNLLREEIIRTARQFGDVNEVRFEPASLFQP